MLVFRLGFSSWFYTAVSVWENDCSGMVIRVLEVGPAIGAAGPVLLGIPSADEEAAEAVAAKAAAAAAAAGGWAGAVGGWVGNMDPPAATENLLPLREACFSKTLWMLGLLVACCSCWLSIPCRNAFTTRIWNKSNPKRYQSMGYLLGYQGSLLWWCHWGWSLSLTNGCVQLGYVFIKNILAFDFSYKLIAPFRLEFKLKRWVLIHR